MKFSLIIPAYNEEKCIRDTVTALVHVFSQAKSISAFEIIVVDNASSDKTTEVVRAFGDSRVRVISILEKGKGRALRAGFLAARGDIGDIVGFTDADLPVAPEDILRALECCNENPHCIVIGSRAHKESKLPGREWWRTGSSQLFNLLARAYLRVPLGDTQCPLKVMGENGKQLFLSTTEPTWFADVEFIALLQKNKVPIMEFPVIWNEHRYPWRQSKLHLVRDGWRALGALRRIRKKLARQKSDDARRVA
jgi:glycosyltransferase involved in cell wall biosynthesis